MKISIQNILDATLGTLLQGDPLLEVSSFSTDSRKIQPKDVFIALKGEHFDAHDFLEEVLLKKPSAILIQEQRKRSDLMAKDPTIVWIGVDDTLYALGNIARAWRRKLTIPLVAISGSNGKTTTKDLSAAILGQAFRVLATEGNLNNLVGVPLTLLRLSERDEAAVIEMGMNDFGEIQRLTEIAEPTVGLLTNVAFAHLEKLKNIEGVARAKGELFAGLAAGTVALVNADDEHISQLPTKAFKISFGFEKPADISATWDRFYEDGVRIRLRFRGAEYHFEAPLIGKSGAKNLLAAVAIGFSLGIDAKAIQKGLKRFKPRDLRMQKIGLRSDMFILNDCYNANLSSMQTALETLKQLKKESPGLAILGEMFEMGAFAPAAHRELGKAVADQGIGYLIAVGPHAKETVLGAVESGLKSEHTLAFEEIDSIDPLLAMLPKWILLGKAVLIKGSRGARMERFTQFLIEWAGKDR